MSKAYWIWNDEDECWVCEACGMAALNNYRGNSVDSNYCPHCGKKMEGCKVMGEEQIGG